MRQKKITLALPALTAFVSMWLWRAKTSQIAVAPNRVPLEKTHELEGQLLQSSWKIFPLIGRSLFEPMDFDTEKINGPIGEFKKKSSVLYRNGRNSVAFNRYGSSAYRYYDASDCAYEL